MTCVFVKENMDNTLSRLMKIFREFSTLRIVDLNSQMCDLWEDPIVEILVGSDELNAIEDEFGIEINENAALDLYDMTLQEAAVLIKNIIKEQNKNSNSSDSIIENLTAEKAKRILYEIWKDSFKARGYITAAIEKVDFEDKISIIKKQ